MPLNLFIIGQYSLVILAGFYLILGFIYFNFYLIPTIRAHTLTNKIENCIKQRELIDEKKDLNKSIEEFNNNDKKEKEKTK